MCGMYDFIAKDAYDLSMGQKQRVTIASVLSVKPKYIIMDEPTAMLDSEGKRDVREIVKTLKEKGLTIIYITNIISEIFIADRVIVLEDGMIKSEFITHDVLDNIELLKNNGIIIPKAIETYKRLRDKGIDVKITDFI